MADTKISALTAATTPLAGTEVLPIVQSSTTKKVAVSDLTSGRAVSALSYASTGGFNFNSAFTSANNYIGCDNTSGNAATLWFRQGRDVGAGSVDAVGLDALNAAGSSVMPMVTRGSPYIIVTTGGEAYRADSNAYLLVGYTSSNGAYRLQVNSQIFATNSTIATSDETYKTDITPLSNALDLVMAMEPVSYRWKKHPVHDFVGGVDIGFSAQRTKKVLADAPYLDNVVKSNTVDLPDGKTEEFLGIADGKLVPLLMAALQELKNEFDAYKATHP